MPGILPELLRIIYITFEIDARDLKLINMEKLFNLIKLAYHIMYDSKHIKNNILYTLYMELRLASSSENFTAIIWDLPNLYLLDAAQPKAKKKNEFFYSIYDEEKFIGLTYLINTNNITYVLYLAIDTNNRGKGYGSIVLDKIKKESNQESIVLCIEEIDQNADNFDQRVKRKKFYEKNEFIETGFKNKEGKRYYEILTNGKKYEKQTYEKMMKKAWGSIPYLLFRVKVEKIQ